MRMLIPVLLCVVGLATACQGYGGDVPAKAEKQKLSPKEIELLVKDLANEKETTRENAAKKLREMPGALTYLRIALADKGIQAANRRQVEELVDQIRSANFKRRLAELAKRKADAQLDLVSELFLENRRYVTRDEWKMATDIVNAISAKLCEGKKNTLKLAGETPPLIFDDVVGAELKISKRSWHRVIADKLTIENRGSALGPFGPNVFFLTNPFEASRKVSQGNIIMINARQNEKNPQEIGKTDASFIFCDGDLNAGLAWQSVLIATGKISHQDFRNEPSSIVIPNAYESPKIRLFSCADFGLKLAEKDSQLNVAGVSADSIAEKSEFKAGDSIEEDDGKSASAASFRRRMRLAYAQEMVIRVAIRRGGKKMEISVSFVE